MRIVLNLQVLEKTIQGISGYIFHYSTDAEYISITTPFIDHQNVQLILTNCTGSRLTWTFFATNYHEFAIFGCGYLRETKTFTLHLTTKTTPIIPNLAPKLCKFQGKGPGTPIERGIFDASQIATHLVDDAIATPKDGWMDPTTTRVGPMGCFFLQGMLLIKNRSLSMIVQIAAKCLRNEAA